jgi:murein hydrolase activator
VNPLRAAVLAVPAAISTVLATTWGFAEDPADQGPEPSVAVMKATAEEPLPAAGRAAASAATLEAAQVRLEAVQAVKGESSGSVAPGADFGRALRDMELALAGLREGIIGAEDELRKLDHELRRDDAEIKRLVAALLTVARTQGGAEPRDHPEGPIAAARAAILLDTGRLGLDRAGHALAGRLVARAAIERLRRDGEETLSAGLSEVAAARARIEAAVRKPHGPPDPASQTARLASDSGTLGDLARALSPSPGPAAEAVASVAVARLAAMDMDNDAVVRSTRNLVGAATGGFEPPVAGRIRLGFRERDGGGVERPGLTFAAAPRAVVTAPASGEVRYVGPHLDWLGVVVLATDRGETALLAGLDATVVEAGDRVAAGAAIGLLGGRQLDAQEFLMLPSQGSDAIGEETLYMEVWRAGEPVDPGPLLDAGGAARNG